VQLVLGEVNDASRPEEPLTGRTPTRPIWGRPNGGTYDDNHMFQHNLPGYWRTACRQWDQEQHGKSSSGVIAGVGSMATGERKAGHGTGMARGSPDERSRVTPVG